MTPSRKKRIQGPCASVMGTSVRMIERHYGALLDGAHTVIAGRLDAFETELEMAAEG
jgi:hypothetical protein